MVFLLWLIEYQKRLILALTLTCYTYMFILCHAIPCLSLHIRMLRGENFILFSKGTTLLHNINVMI